MTGLVERSYVTTSNVIVEEIIVVVSDVIVLKMLILYYKVNITFTMTSPINPSSIG